MSETTDMIQDAVAEMPVPGPESATDETNSAPEGETTENGNKAAKEAAKYRTRLREAEAALEAANARIEGYQRAEVERLASDKLSEPGDLLTLSGKTVQDFLTEDGSVDADAVNEAVQEIITSRPGLGKAQRAYDPTQGLGGDVRKAPTFDGLLSPANLRAR